MSVKSDTLPPLAPVKNTSSKPPSVAGSRTSAQAQLMSAANDVNDKQSEGRGSHRSSQHQGSIHSNQGKPPSVAKSGSLKVGGSERSITSSEALSKLQKLEDMLLAERRAREEAENTLLSIQREKYLEGGKSGIHRAAGGGADPQQQLSDIMGALQRLLAQPNDPNNVRKLQAIVRGAPVHSANAPPTPTSSQQTPSLGPKAGVASETKEEDAPKSFLDQIGQFDRDRKAKQRHRSNKLGA